MSESLQTPHGGTRLGLVLGGGAALGAAHAGILQALDEAGVRCSVVVGTSAGALIGGGYAAGLTGGELTKLVLAAQWSTFAQWHPNRRWGLLDSSPLERSIEEYVGTRLIEDLERRFGAVAFDPLARELVLIESGSLATALRASSAVPGLFPPVRIEGRLLVDGGVSDNVPVWAARKLGADYVIAVGVDSGPAANAGVTARVLDTVSGARRARTRDIPRASAAADVFVHPDTQGLSRWTPKDVPQLVDAGRRALESSLQEIYQMPGIAPPLTKSSGRDSRWIDQTAL
ncbi:MAG: patatin-like phospholipase family protein [Candidatus Nanopelagicaceae bacterium]